MKVATGITLATGILVGVFAAEALLDGLVNLPWAVRAIIFLGTIGGTAFLLWRETIAPLRKRLDDDAVALLIEHALPGFRTRFIASVQLARAGGDGAGRGTSSLVRALVAETAAMAARFNFRRVVKTEKLKRGLKISLSIVAVASALAWYGGDASVLLFKRAMLFNTPLPRKTHLLTVTGDRKIGAGEDLKIDVTASGVIPARGRVVATGADGKQREYPLEPEAEKSKKFSAIIRGPQESFTYRVFLNDAISEPYHVQTFQRPAVVKIACEQAYPAYTGIRPVERALSDLTLLAGSRLKLAIKANTKVGKGFLRLAGTAGAVGSAEAGTKPAGPGPEIPLKVDAADPTLLRGEIEIPAKGLAGFSVHLVSPEGIESGESATYRIDLVPDREPAVKITSPGRREELATMQAAMPIAFEAKDDFAVAKATLHYNVDQGTAKTIDFDLGARAGKTATRRFDWNLATLQPRLAVGNVIEFWVTVADSNDVTGPGIGTSEHYQIKMVTEEEKRLDLANRFMDTMGGVREVTGSQEELNKSLGEPLFQKPKEIP